MTRITIDLSALAGCQLHPTERTLAQFARIVPEQGQSFDWHLDGTPLPPGTKVRVAYVHAEVLRQLAAQKAVA